MNEYNDHSGAKAKSMGSLKPTWATQQGPLFQGPDELLNLFIIDISTAMSSTPVPHTWE